MKKVYSYLAILFFGAAFGYVTSQHAGNWSEPSRDPAAVSMKWSYDYSNLTGEDLRAAIRQRLMSQLVVKKSENGSGFAFGHFEFLNSKGEKKFACSEYENLTMVFEGESRADHSVPRMEVTGKCKYSEDLTMIQPVMIPTAIIQAQKAEDGEYIFKDDDNLYIKFQNINESWPHQWTLRTLQLIGADNNSPLIFSELEIKKSLGSLPVLYW